ncbi:Uncharacterized protein APZ42_029196 [Daphnia magna]|uniref:Uncharacterized protein n=1 Tax=Daphnia magna TaxID=35525 RepID=A0A164PUW3_9CRUS|nr:Uncharacterized protein APZ42_029196 [Daphnia magna]
MRQVEKKKKKKKKKKRREKRIGKLLLAISRSKFDPLRVEKERKKNGT